MLPPGATSWNPFGPDRTVEGSPAGPVVDIASDIDLFDPAVEAADIRRVLEVVGSTPGTGYVLLTSRAKRMLALGNEGLRLPANLWLGVVVRSDADVWRAEDLLRCNTSRAWVSVDPMEGPVPSLPVSMLRWVACGGAPADLDWVRALRDRCVEASVPFAYQRPPTPLDGTVWDQYPAELVAGHR